MKKIYTRGLLVFALIMFCACSYAPEGNASPISESTPKTEPFLYKRRTQIFGDLPSGITKSKVVDYETQTSSGTLIVSPNSHPLADETGYYKLASFISEKNNLQSFLCLIRPTESDRGLKGQNFYCFAQNHETSSN